MTSERLQSGGGQVDLRSPYRDKQGEERSPLGVAPNRDTTPSDLRGSVQDLRSPHRHKKVTEKGTRVDAVGFREPLPLTDTVRLYGGEVTDIVARGGRWANYLNPFI